MREYIQKVPSLPSDQPLERFLETNLGFARSYLRAHKSLNMMFLGFTANSEVVCLQPEISSDADKDRAVLLVRQLFAVHGVIRYCVMSEAWMSRRTDRAPSESPDREEVLLVTVGDAGRDLSALCPMRRDTKGRLLRVDKPETMGGGGFMAGRFTRLLDPADPAGEALLREAKILARRYGVGAREYLH